MSRAHLPPRQRRKRARLAVELLETRRMLAAAPFPANIEGNLAALIQEARRVSEENLAGPLANASGFQLVQVDGSQSALVNVWTKTITAPVVEQFGQMG